MAASASAASWSSAIGQRSSAAVDALQVRAQRVPQPLLLVGVHGQEPQRPRQLAEVRLSRRGHHERAAGGQHARDLRPSARGEHNHDDRRGVVAQRQPAPRVGNHDGARGWARAARRAA